MSLLGREEEFNRLEMLLKLALARWSDVDDELGKGNARKRMKRSSGVATSEGSYPLAIYVSGMPGTGKTATVRAVVECLLSSTKKASSRKRKASHLRNEDTSFDFIAINCFASSTPASLYREILERIGVQPGAVGRLASQLSQAFLERKRPLVLFLDEIDNLVAKTARLKDALLQKVFEWPAASQGSVILIGVANSLDLTERLLPKLKRSLSHPYAIQPELITFPPYTQEQLSAILEERLNNSVGEDGVMDRKAIALCARKVSAMTGDVRRAFQIAAQTLQAMRDEKEPDEETEKENAIPPIILRRSEEAEREIRKKLGGTPQKFAVSAVLRRPEGVNVNVTPSKHGMNACREVLKSIEKVSASPVQRARLPLQAQIVLATLMHLISTSAAATASRWTNRRPPTTKDKLLGAYEKICSKLSLITMAADEMSNVLSILESQGMISMKRKAQGRGSSLSGIMISFEVEFSEARRVVNDPKALCILADIETVVL